MSANQSRMLSQGMGSFREVSMHFVEALSNGSEEDKAIAAMIGDFMPLVFHPAYRHVAIALAASIANNDYVKHGHVCCLEEDGTFGVREFQLASTRKMISEFMGVRTA